MTSNKAFYSASGPGRDHRQLEPRQPDSRHSAPQGLSAGGRAQAPSAHQSASQQALADKLDRLAMRLQQMSGQPVNHEVGDQRVVDQRVGDHGASDRENAAAAPVGHPSPATPAPDMANSTPGMANSTRAVAPDFRHPDHWMPASANNPTPSSQVPSRQVASSPLASSPAPSRSPIPRYQSAAPHSPGASAQRQAVPGSNAAAFDESRFDRYTEAFDPGRRDPSRRDLSRRDPGRGDLSDGSQPNRPFDPMPSARRAVDERRPQDRQAIPTAEDIGRAVEDMRAAAQSSAPQAAQAPSTQGIPRRRKSDWSRQARKGRHHDDVIFQESAADSDMPPIDFADKADLDRLNQMNDRLTRSIQNVNGEDFGQLRADVREVRNMVRDTAPHRSLYAIETGLEETINRLDHLSRELQDPGKSQRLEQRVEEMAHLLASMPHVQDVNGLEQRIAHLAQRFEDNIAAGLNPAEQANIAAGLQKLHQLMHSIDPNQMHQRLEQRLQELGANIAAVETVARDARGYAADLYGKDQSGVSELGDRLFAELSHLRTQLADADQAGNLRVLQSQIDVLSHKIDLIDANQASDSNRGFEQLENALGHLSADLPHLHTIAQGVQKLERHIEAVHQNMALFAGGDSFGPLGGALEGALGGALEGAMGPVEERLARLEDSARFIGEAVSDNTTEARLAQLSQQLVDLGQHVRSGQDETAALITRSLQGMEFGARDGLTATDLKELQQRMADVHALVGSSSQSDQLGQIQSSLNQMINTLGVDLRQEMLDRLETQIGRLGDRVEGLTDIDTLTRMEATIRKLSGVFETSDRFDRLLDVEGRLSAVVDRFEQANTAVSAQDMSDLQTQIADIRAHLTRPSEQQTAVEEAMAALTARLDHVAEKPNEAQLIERLEQQMTAVAERFASSVQPQVDFSPLEQRLLDIERHLGGPNAATSNETIELARTAARDAVREVAQEMAAQQENEPDPVIEELRTQIGSLQAANEQGRAEQDVILQKVSQSLDEILDRLDGPGQASDQRPYDLNAEEIAPSNDAIEPLQPAGLDISSSAAQARLADFDAQLARDQSAAYEDAPPSDETHPSNAFDEQHLAHQGLEDRQDLTAEPLNSRSAFDPMDSGSISDSEEDFTPQALGQRGEAGFSSVDDASPTQAAEHPASNAARRESVSDLRARLFGGGAEEAADMAPEPEATKSAGLRGRLLGPKAKDGRHQPAPQPTAPQDGAEDDTTTGRRWGWSRKPKSAPEANDQSSVAGPAAYGSDGAFEPEVDLIGRDPILEREPSRESDPAFDQDPTLDLNQSERPDANTLSDEFQPLSPGQRPLQAPQEQGQDRSSPDRASAKTDATAESAQPTSLMGRLGRALGRKSGTAAVSAGAALLLAGSIYLHRQVENDQLAAFLGELAGEPMATIAEAPAVTQPPRQTAALGQSVDGLERAESGTPSVDLMTTASLGPKNEARVGQGPTQKDIYLGQGPTQAGKYVGQGLAQAGDNVDQQAASPAGTADGFSLQSQPAGLSTSQFTKQEPGTEDGAEDGTELGIAEPLTAANESSQRILEGPDRLQRTASRSVLSPDLASLGTKALRIAAAEGNSDAQFQIGYLLLTGHSGEARPGDAVIWFQKSAAQHHAPAQFQLGLLHKHGRGTPQDKAKAQIWFKRAAENGNVMAMHALAVSYSEGAAGPPDYHSAATWFERAAEHGIKDSQFNIGLIYARGLGTQQDLTSSYKWFALAARQGDRDAGDKRDAIASKLNRQQLAAAKLAADTWERTQPDMIANRVTILPDWQADAPDVADPKESAAAGAPAPDVSDQSPQLVPSELLIKETQRLLSEQGYDTGGIDGQLGPKTTAAIRSFQRDTGMDETGIMSPSLLRQLLSAQS